jgi:hypothetical protein
MYRQGCRLAIHNKEFYRREFGSRQLVYVLDDPHRLLKQSFVFKHTDRTTAEYEVSALEGFQVYLRRTGAPELFKLPEPITIIPLEENNEVGYVMRRARGEQLGQSSMNSPKSPTTIQAYQHALKFLAYYHAWGVERMGMGVFSKTNIASLVLKTTRFFKSCGISIENRNKLSRAIQSLIPPNLPSLIKKDAHPENWLIDANENIVMLDLETQTFCPLFLELVQLLDDYPLLEVTFNGWQTRMGLCKTYIEALLSLKVDTTEYIKLLPDAYEAFALLRTSFGLARNKTKARWSSSSAVREASIRNSHYLQIIRFLSETSTNSNIRNCAYLLGTEFNQI